MIGWDEQEDLTAPAVETRAAARASWTLPSPAVAALVAMVLAAGGVIGTVWRPSPGAGSGRVALQASAGSGPLATTRPVSVAGVRLDRTVDVAAVGTSAVAPTPAATVASTPLTAVAEGTGIRLSDGRLVGLLGLDAAALPAGQDCRAGTLASVLATLVPEATPVTVEGDPSDGGGVYVRRLADGQLLNAVLLSLGAAPAAPGELRLRALLSGAAGDAMTAGRGVWARCPGNVVPMAIELPPSEGG